jgi:hypothetical protein
MLTAYIHWFEKNNLFSAGFVCCLFLQLIPDGGAVSVHNMQTHFHLPITIIIRLLHFFNCPL